MREKGDIFRPGFRAGVLAILALAVMLLFPAAGHAASLSGLETRHVKTYPCVSGQVRIFEESTDQSASETVPARGLLITLKKEENGYYYGSCTVNGTRHSGWFRAAAILTNPEYKAKSETIRHKVTVYRTKGGRKWLTSREYVPVEIVGKSGSWYQMLFSWGNSDRLGWVRASDVRIGGSIIEYDSTPKQILADGTYTMRPSSDLAEYAAADGSALTLAAGNGAAARFSLQCDTPNRFRICSEKTGEYLTAGEEGVILAEKSSTEEQLWALKRKGAYYTVRSVSDGGYLCAGQPFALSDSAGSDSRFRITMQGKNRDHWQVFSQFDPEWGGKLYGKTNTIAGAGCGVLSSVNAVYALNGQFMAPMMVAKYAVKKHYRIEGQGTMYTFVAAAARHFGPDYGYKYAGETLSLSRLKRHLLSGGTAVGYVPGHYIAIADYKNGRYLVLDSYAMPKRKTTAFGNWVSPRRFRSGSLKAKKFLLLKAVK